MSDTLVDSEILGVWQRIRSLIDLSKITATDKMNRQEQLRSAMEHPLKTNPKFPINMDTLIENNFPAAFVQNEEIQKELLGERVSQIKVRGQTRFQIKGGTRGTGIRAGTFLRGKTKEQALDDFIGKLAFPKEDKKEE